VREPWSVALREKSGTRAAPPDAPFTGSPGGVSTRRPAQISPAAHWAAGSV